MFVKNTSIRDLEKQVNAVHQSGQLRYTQSQNRHAGEAIDPVPYFIIPYGAAREMGTLIMSYVNLTKRGFLSLDAKKMYGVREQPTDSVVPHETTRLREAHVIAEDLALSHGIYTEFGRASAEIFVARTVVTQPNLGVYIADRIDHLDALSSVIEKEQIFLRIGQITGELERATDSLRAHLQIHGN